MNPRPAAQVWRIGGGAWCQSLGMATWGLVCLGDFDAQTLL